MKRLAVLLRAVNVGGTGKLAMADFKAALSALGCGEVATLGAAGSAVVASGLDPAALEARLEKRLDQSLGLASDAFARDHAELRDILAGNPFEAMARDLPSGLVVLFLKRDPHPDHLQAVRDRIRGPELAEAGPRCLYIAYGEGMGRSKLSPAILERALGQRGTARNLNSVGKLCELTR